MKDKFQRQRGEWIRDSPNDVLTSVVHVTMLRAAGQVRHAVLGLPLPLRWEAVRHLSSDVPLIFDREAKLGQRRRAAFLTGESTEYDYLKDEVADLLLDRLDDIQNRTFPVVLDLGSGYGHLLKRLEDRGGVETLTMLDSCEAALRRDEQKDAEFNGDGEIEIKRIVADEESFSTNFPEQAFDAIVSNLSLNWTNDLPGVFAQARKCLKEDGLFLAAMYGGDTLQELRISFQMAEMAVENGVSVRVSPFVNVADIGALLQRAGFRLPTVDSDTITLEFPDVDALVRHIRCMGETNAASLRRNIVPRKTYEEMCKYYKENFPSPDGNGIVATVQVLYLIGWVPHSSQQQAKTRGSASVSMKTLSNDSFDIDDLGLRSLEQADGPKWQTITEDGIEEPEKK